LADDLTGACATGALVCRRGGKAPVWLAQAPQGNIHLPDGSVGIVDLDVRFAPPELAAQWVGDWWRSLRATWDGPMGLRIDSTLRGPIGAVIRAVLAGDIHCGAVLTPAFPESGRTTRGGRHFVYGRPVSQTEVAHDPWTPVHTDDVRELIHGQLGESAALLPLSVVRAGSAAIAAALDALPERVVVADAETNADIEALAAAMGSLWKRARREASARTRQWLPVDPGPLSAAYAACVYGFAAGRTGEWVGGWCRAYDGGYAQPAPRQGQQYEVRCGPPVLAVCGSLMETARRQLSMLARLPGVQVIVLPAGEALAHVRMLHEHVRRRWLPDTVVLVVATPPVLGADPAVVAPAVAGLTQVLWSEVPFAGCYLSGGDIAAHTLRALGVTRLDIEMEVLPLAVRSRLVDGPFAGRPIVTKGGAVGGQDAMIRCIAALQQA